MFTVYKKRRDNLLWCDQSEQEILKKFDTGQSSVITLQSAFDLKDKASKLIALSDMEVVIPTTEIVTTSLQAGKTKG